MTSPHITGLTPYVPGLAGGDVDLSLVGSGLSIPWGVDAVFQYNGLTFNDRGVVDKIRVTSIDGVDDADVRDSREDNPADDGEVIYNSLYGGRTVVLNGRVEAFQRDKLRDMQQALRTAFSDISEERPLYFLTGDRATDHFLVCKKFSKLQWTEEQKTEGVYYRDFQITVRASNPRFYSYREKNINTGYFTQSSVVGELCTNPEFGTNTTGWTNSGMTTFARVTGLTPTPDGTTTGLHYIADTSGDNVQFALAVTSGHTYTFTARSAKIGGAVNTAALTINNAGGTEKAASSAFATTATSGWIQRTVSFTADSTATWTFRVKVTGLSYDGYLTDVSIYDSDTSTEYFLNDSTELVNLGNYSSEPVYKIFGPMDDVQFDIESVQGVESFKLLDSVTIADGDFYEVNIKNKTVKDQDGNNKFADVATDSDFPKLQSGNNSLTIPNGKSLITNGNANIAVAYRDAYI